MPKLSPHSIALSNGVIVLSKREGGAMWQARYEVSGLWIRVTTKMKDLDEAKEVASDLYMESRYRVKHGIPAQVEAHQYVQSEWTFIRRNVGLGENGRTRTHRPTSLLDMSQTHSPTMPRHFACGVCHITDRQCCNLAYSHPCIDRQNECETIALNMTSGFDDERNTRRILKSERTDACAMMTSFA